MRVRAVDRLGEALLLFLVLLGGAGAFALLSGNPLFRLVGLRGAASPYGASLPGDGLLFTRSVAALLIGLGLLALGALLFPNRADRALSSFLRLWEELEERKPMLLLFLVALAFGVYGGSFRIGYYADDFVWRIEAGRSAAEIRHIFSLSVSHFFKPLTHLLHLVQFRFFSDPHPAHLCGLLLHGVNAFLLSLVVSALSRRKGLALLSALLFCVYSVSNRSVMWLSGSEITLGATFYLLTLQGFLGFLERSDRFSLASALLFCLLGLLTKEAVITVVPTLILIALFQKRARLGITALLFGSLGLLYLALEFLIQSGGFLVTQGLYGFRPFLLLENLCLYLFVSLVPQGHKLLAALPPLRLLVFLAVPAVTLLVLGKGGKLTRFFLLWDLLLLAPFLPFNLPVQPRYLYLPALAFCPLLALLLLHGRERLLSGVKRGPSLFALALALIFGVNLAIVQGAAVRMARESRQVEEYLRALRADPLRMDQVRRGLLPPDSPLTGDHLRAALENEDDQ